MQKLPEHYGFWGKMMNDFITRVLKPSELRCGLRVTLGALEGIVDTYVYLQDVEIVNPYGAIGTIVAFGNGALSDYGLDNEKTYVIYNSSLEFDEEYDFDE